MSKFNRETVKALSKLCRIDCTEEEEISLMHDLEKIINYFEQLDEIDTEGVPPCNHVLDDIANVMRDDEIGELLPRDVFLANAPSHTGGMIKVPPVIKGR